ncbi:MAG TPA: T9SS type A sorting domain-containing protein, partial [Bacteroidia bacterium]|nr:T9SS type A sorting domain-containing protein [Bacteroidia bacterium]
SASTWNPVGVPTSGDSVTISTGTTVTMDKNNATCNYLLIKGTAEWNLAKKVDVGSGGITLDNALLTFSGTIGTLKTTGDLRTVGDTSTINGVKLEIGGSTIVNAGAVFKTTATNGAKQTNDLIVNGSWDCLVSDAWKIDGNLTFNGTAFVSGGGTYSFTGSNKTISGNPITIDRIKIDTLASVTNTTSLTVITDLTGLGTFSQGANSTLNISTTSSHFKIAHFNASANGNTFIYDRDGVQKIEQPNDGAYYNLKLEGTNTKSTTGTLKINGDLTIQSKLDVTTNNDSILLDGNWTNNGIFDKRKGIVFLNGNSTQEIFNATNEFFYKLICNGNGTKMLASAISVDSTLEINSSCSLDVGTGNYQITLKGNWINNGTFNAEKGNILLDGNVAQQLGGTNSTSFYDIDLKNTAGTYIANAENLLGTLTLTKGTFTTTGKTFTLTSNANGTARIASIPSVADFIGNITMQRYIPTGENGWRFLASAVSGATLQQWANCFATSGFTGSTDPSNSFTSIYRYDETSLGNFSNGYVAATNVTNPILNTGGYWCYVGPTPLTIKVTGTPNKFTQTFSPTYTASTGASQDGWNMISNTYPSAIDWDASGWTKTNINNAIYIWNSQLQQYASYVAGVGTNGGSNVIPTSQSFWVQANASNPKLKMKENVKTAANQAFTKINALNNTSNQKIHLRISGNNFSDETYILFNSNATKAFDSLYDSRKLFSTNTAVPSISSLSINADYAINTLPELDSSISIPIRVKVGTSGIYTISSDNLTNIPASSCLVLEDLLKGTSTDLKSTNSYTFSISDTTKDPRFLLHICYDSPTSVNAIAPQNNSVRLLTSNNNYSLQFSFDKVSDVAINVINMLGQKIISDQHQKVQNNTIPLNFPSTAKGIYFVRVQTDNQSFVFKVFR